MAVTDALGRFRITEVPPGAYAVVARPGGYRGRYLPMAFGAARANDPGRPVTIPAGEEIADINIGVTTGIAIEGRVLEDTGEPLSRVPVFAARLHAGSESPQRSEHATAISDDLGRFRIYGLEPGTYIVGADALFITPAVESFNGRVFSLSLEPRESEPFLTTYHPSVTVHSAAQPVRIASQDATGIDIVVQRAARFPVSGTVIDSQGAPAASTALVLLHGGIGTLTHSSFTTDQEGRFHGPALEVGSYRLLIGSGLWSGLSAVNKRTEFADVAVTVAGAPVELNVVTQPGIAVSGRVVVAEGLPSPPAVKVMFRQGHANIEVPATMGDDGHFVRGDLFGPALVRVSSLPRGWAVKSVNLAGIDITDVPTTFTQRDDGRLEVVLTSRASSLEGQVRSEEPRRSGDAVVYVFSEDRMSWTSSSPRTLSTEVTEDGRFSVTGLAAGRYFVIAVARDGFRTPPSPGPAFFELLSRDATPVAVGDDERRTLELRAWRWPE